MGWVDAYAPSVSLVHLRRKVGMVFQHPNELPFSIMKNFTLPLSITMGLNKHATRKIEELFLELNPRYTILAVTHSMNQMRRLAGRFLVMNQGQLIRDLDRDLIRDQDACDSLFDDVF
jgi:ABC-type phosphate transport system ATPase subunit